MSSNKDRTIAYMLCESTTSAKPKIISEGMGSNQMVKVNAVLQETEVLNRNGRKYFKKFLEPALAAPHIKELQQKKSWLGEAGHPVNPTMERQVTILQDRAAIRINKHWWDGSLVYGEIEALNTEFGRMFHNLVLQELETAYSLRALGAIKAAAGCNEVHGPMRVVSYDWVILPSHSNAYQSEIVQSTMVEAKTKKIIAESAAIPLFNTEIEKYIASCDNFKIVAESLEMFYEDMHYDAKKQMIIVRESDTQNVIYIPTEKKLDREITNFIANSNIFRTF